MDISVPIRYHADADDMLMAYHKDDFIKQVLLSKDYSTPPRNIKITYFNCKHIL